MMKAIKALLALAVALAIGVGWNFIWSKSSHHKNLMTRTTSVRAEADEKGKASFKLQPFTSVSGIRQRITADGVKVDLSGLNDVTGLRYGMLLNELAHLKSDKRVNYWQALKYAELKSSEGEGTKLWGQRLDNQIRGQYGEKTLKVAKDLTFSKSISPWGYSAKPQMTTVDPFYPNEDLDVAYAVNNQVLTIEVHLDSVYGAKLASYRIHGVRGKTVNLENSEIATLLQSNGRIGYQMDRKTVTFNDHDLQVEKIVLEPVVS